LPGLEATVSEKVKEGGERLRTYTVAPLAEAAEGGQDGGMTDDRRARARSLGFDTSTTYYRGGRSLDMRGATWVTPDPDYAALFPLYNYGETAVAPLWVRADRILDLTRFDSDHAFT